MDPEWQAELIAAYLIDAQIEAVLAQDNARKQNDSQERQERGPGRGRAPYRSDSM